MEFHSSPFFWAFVAMVGLHGATLMVSGHPLGRNILFVTVVLTLVTAGRIVLVLPMCEQPRLVPAGWHDVVGGLIVVVALAIAAPALSVKWWRPPEAGMKLHATGVYGIVRNPIYLCEVLWPVGWSLMWGSIYGLALAPLWWMAFLLHALAEERQMETVMGDEFAEYKRKVRGRIFPGLPV